MTSNETAINIQDKKHIKMPEFIAYLVAVFFYTIFHGIMMFLAGVPFFFYKLTGKTKEEVHERVLAQRAALEKAEKE